MAKRRRKKHNLSKAVLDQARQSSGDPAETPASTAARPVREAAPSQQSDAARRRRRRRDLGAAQLERRKDEGSLDAETVADLLANPTKVVSESELRAEYGFVIKDLRNMGILAAALFIALVIVSLLIL